MKKSVNERALSRFTVYLGKKICNHSVLVYILNLTWGLLSTIAGYLVFLVMLPFCKVERYNNILVLRFKKINPNYTYGFSIGLCMFVSGNAERGCLMCHEYGHTVQNAIFGPLMPFIVLLPSVIRFHYRERLIRKGIKLTTCYDDIWFEYSASAIGKHCNFIND